MPRWLPEKLQEAGIREQVVLHASAGRDVSCRFLHIDNISSS
jgi:hypothetical protein